MRGQLCDHLIQLKILKCLKYLKKLKLNQCVKIEFNSGCGAPVARYVRDVEAGSPILPTPTKQPPILSRERESDPRPSPYQGLALPLSHPGLENNKERPHYLKSELTNQ